MEDTFVWLAVIGAFLRADPTFSYIIDNIPLMVVGIFGAVVDLTTTKRKITVRESFGGMLAAAMAALVLKAVLQEFELGVNMLVAGALVAGYKAIPVFSVLGDKLVARIKNDKRFGE